MAKKNNPAPNKAPVAQTNAGPNPMGAPARSQSAPMPLSQALRQAGEGGVSKPELKSILSDTGKSSSQLIQQLDKINQNLKAKDKTGINLGAGASNMLIREASKQVPTGYDAYLNMISGTSRYGTGRMGTELQRRADEFRTTGSMGSLVPRGMSTMPSGRLTLPGVGPQFGMPKTVVKNPIELDTGRTKPTELDQTVETTQPVDQVEPMTPEDMQAASTLGFDGAGLTNWATGFKSKKSSRKGAGQRAQGLGSQRVNPAGTFRGGM